MADHVVEAIPTLPSARDDAAAVRARNWRRVGTLALWLVVLAGLVGLLGVRMSITAATAGGWTLRVEAPSISRGALDAPIRLEVRRTGGFGESVTVQVDRALFTRLDANLVVPAPAEETGSATAVEWTFDAPPGDVLVVTIDARLAPSEMPGVEHLRFAILERGEVAVEVQPRLVVLP